MLCYSVAEYTEENKIKSWNSIKLEPQVPKLKLPKNDARQWLNQVGIQGPGGQRRRNYESKAPEEDFTNQENYRSIYTEQHDSENL